MEEVHFERNMLRRLQICKKMLFSRNFYFFFKNKKHKMKKPNHIKDLIHSLGSPLEEHKVTTKDGYILTLHRIPGKEGSHPILFMHGMLTSSSIYFLAKRPDETLPFMVHNKGFDIWLGNNRGNPYSEHVSLDKKSSQFWNFSFHEMGLHDLPTTIDYILNHTNSTKLDYVGYSQGTSQYFVMTSLLPEYNPKIRRAYMLAPVAYLGNSGSSMIRFLGKLICRQGGGILGLRQIGIYNLFIKLTLKYNPITISFLKNIFGESANNETWKLYFQNIDQLSLGASTKQLYHYYQLIDKAGVFKFYDYGEKKNLDFYQSSIPPEYPLNKSTAEVVLFYGGSDPFTPSEDINLLVKQLSNVKGMHFIKNYNHLDFILDQNTKIEINDILINEYIYKEKKF